MQLTETEQDASGAYFLYFGLDSQLEFGSRKNGFQLRKHDIAT